MNVKFGLIAPWPLTSLARAIQQPGKNGGEETNFAQKLLYHRAKCNGAAYGQIQPKMERSLHLHKGLAALRLLTVPPGFGMGCS